MTERGGLFKAGEVHSTARHNNLSLSRLQQQSLPMHQQIGHIRKGSPGMPLLQPKAGKTGSKSSDSGSNPPEMHRHAPIKQTLPKTAAS